jgi:hypothetical protein
MSLGAEIGPGLSHLGHAERDDARPRSADDGDGLLDLGPVLVGEIVEFLANALDQAAHPADLVVRGHRLALGPVVGLGENAASRSRLRRRSAR